jgi:hypothetical protein
MHGPMNVRGCVYHCVGCFLYTAKVVTVIRVIHSSQTANHVYSGQKFTISETCVCMETAVGYMCLPTFKGNHCPLRVGKWNQMGYWVKACHYHPAHCLIGWKT